MVCTCKVSCEPTQLLIAGTVVAHMKRVITIITVIFAILGIAGTILTIRNMQEENRLESAYAKNCDNLRVGMTMREAQAEMRKGLYILHRGFDYEIGTENDSISNITMNYTIEGGSDIISIEIDNITGLVKSYKCPEKI